MNNNKPVQLGFKATRTLLKISILLFIVGGIMSVLVVSGIDGTGNYYQLDEGEDATLIYGYATNGENIQIAYGIENDVGDYDRDERFLDQENLEVLGELEYSETFTFDEVEVVKTQLSNEAFYSLNAKEGFYRLRLTNVNDESIVVITGMADATMGQIVSLVLALILIVLGGTGFSLAMSIFWITILIAAILYILEMNDRPKQPIYQVYTEESV